MQLLTRLFVIGAYICSAAVFGIPGNTAAQSLSERGGYLVNSILACGNCHTPKSPEGKSITEKNLAGGLSFTTPAFDAHASNVTPDRETGIGAWSDDEIKRALVDGVRPNHGRLANMPLAAVIDASRFLQGDPTARYGRSGRLSSQCKAREQQIRRAAL